MSLSSDLISQFVKVTNDEPVEQKETIVYGTVTEYDGGKGTVRLDGASEDQLTPVSFTSAAAVGNRVTILIKNHEAIVTGNVSSPSARTEDVKEIGDQIVEFDNVMADTITTQQIDAIYATFDRLTAITGRYDELSAITASIETLKASYIEGGKVSASDIKAITAEIERISGEFADFTEISADDINAFNAEITNLHAHNAQFTYVSAEKLIAVKVDVDTLTAELIDAKTGKFTFAKIDFADIGEAAIKNLFAKSGIIKELAVGDQVITGELVGVTFKGDLIEGNTVVADKLVVRGEDGLYYKLNMLGIGSNAKTRYVKTGATITPTPDGTAIEGVTTSTLEQVYEYRNNSGNLFDKDTMVTVGYWWQTDGTQCILASNRYTAAYGAMRIPVDGIEKITMSIPNATANRLLYNYYFTGDGDTIIETAVCNVNIGETDSYTVVVPSGAKEFRVSLAGYKSEADNGRFPMVVAGDTPMSYEPYTPKVMYYTVVDDICYEVELSSSDIEIEQTDYNSLNGSVITAKSITAEKVNVKDLVAFGATIGGFHITDTSIYSGSKASVDNSNPGIHLDKDGNAAFGDDTNYVKFYKADNGKHKLEIAADTISFGSGAGRKSVDAAINEQKESINAVGNAQSRFESKVNKQITFSGDNAITIGGSSGITLIVDNYNGIIFAKHMFEESSGNVGSAEVDSVVTTYQASENNSEVPTDEWLDAVPKIQNGEFLWVRTVIEYVNKATKTIYRVAFGQWDGDDFYTGNIVVRTEEQARFGNFAYVPRSDGSLMFLKVGG